jgi:uncharacterized protein Veg
LYNKNDLIKIKNAIRKNIGKKITLVSKKNKKDNNIQKGSIISVYPSVFVVRFDIDSKNNFDKLTTYSYIDLLTKSIELFLCSCK